MQHFIAYWCKAAFLYNTFSCFALIPQAFLYCKVAAFLYYRIHWSYYYIIGEIITGVQRMSTLALNLRC